MYSFDSKDQLMDQCFLWNYMNRGEGGVWKNTNTIILHIF